VGTSQSQSEVGHRNEQSQAAVPGQIDNIDLLIKNCNMFYVSWTYWHASKLHVQALWLVVA
jgi:hypothetical protein